MMEICVAKDGYAISDWKSCDNDSPSMVFSVFTGGRGSEESIIDRSLLSLAD